MSSYVYQPNFSYKNYLQARSFEESIRLEFNNQTKQLIASEKKVKEEVVKRIGHIAESIELVGNEICYKLSDIHNSIVDLNATFNWGFSEMLTSIGLINESLESLIKIATTPAQTWAYEQFEIARDAYRKELYEEALEYLDKAINGYKSNAGYKIEYRFHFLKGVIHLGSFKNNSVKIINSQKAEESFINAYRYSKSDYPNRASKSLLNAGWAAYCQGEMKRAREHTQRSLQIDSKFADGFFQLAKIELHLNILDSGIQNLKSAIELDRLFAIKATNDGDIMKFNKDVYDLFKKLKNETEKEYKSLYSKVEPKISKLKLLYGNDPLQGNASQVLQCYNNGKDSAEENTLFGYLYAIESFQDVYKNIHDAISERENVIEVNIRNNNYKRKQKNANTYGGFIGGFLGLVLGAAAGALAGAICSLVIVLPIAFLSIFDPSLGENTNDISIFFAIIGGIGGGIYGAWGGAAMLMDFLRNRIKL